MEKSILFLAIVLFVGCQVEPDNLVQLNEQNAVLESLIVSVKTEIGLTVEETGIERTPLHQVNFVDSVYSVFQNLVYESSTREIEAEFNSWKQTINQVFATDISLIYDDMNSKGALENELKIKTLGVLNEIEKSIVIPEQTFDQIEVVFIPELHRMKIGETYTGEVYIAALMRNSSEFVDYYINDQKLEKNDDGGGIISITPNSLGIYTVSVKATINYAKTEGFNFEDSFDINVER